VEKTVIVKETVETEVEVEVEKTVEVEKLVEVERTVEVEVEKEVVLIKGQPVWSAPDFSGKEYKFWGLQFDPHIAAYERLAASFEELTGAKATIEPQSNVSASLLTAIATGDPPDVICAKGDMVSTLAPEGAILPVDDTVFATTGCDPDTWFYPNAYQAYQFEGQTWGVPTEASNSCCVVNVHLDMLDAADADVQAMWPPNQGNVGFESFEDMWTLAENLQETDEDGNVVTWGLSSKDFATDGHLLGIMRTLGQPWWDLDKQTFYLDSDEALEAMRLLVTIPVFELGIETQLADMSGFELFAGKVAVAVGHYVYSSLGREQGVRVDIGGYPSAFKGRKPLFVGEAGWGFMVPSTAKEIELGTEFLKYVTTYEGNKEYCYIYGGQISSVPAVMQDPELFPPGDYVADAFRRCADLQWDCDFMGEGFGNVSEARSLINNNITAVRTGDLTDREACLEIQAGLIEGLERYKELGS
jgi:ABC-type glycerol-3-phosphate transport system substrate-binding protein